MIRFRILILFLLLTTTSLALAGYWLLATESCYGAAAATGQCSQIIDFVLEWVGVAGFYVSSNVIHWGIRQRWKAVLHKRPIFVLTSVGAVTGAIVAYGAYYAARVAGLVMADYSTCGGYRTPLGCFTFNPFVPLWFILTGSVTGFEALLVFAVKRGTINAPANLGSTQHSS